MGGPVAPCSNPVKTVRPCATRESTPEGSRGDRIRTCDLLVPNEEVFTLREFPCILTGQTLWNNTTLERAMSVRFSRLASAFLNWASKCRHQKTVEVYRHYYQKFLREVGDKPAHRVTPAVLSAWATTWHQSQAIVRLYRWAITDAKMIRKNPLDKVTHPPKGERHRIIDSSEMVKLLRACPPDLRRLLIAYRESMARPGELRAATWAHLYPRLSGKEMRGALRRGEVSIVLKDFKNRKSRRLPNALRVVLISPRLGRMIARLMRQPHHADDFIFQTERGQRWTANALRCRMRRLRASLGITRDERGETIVPYTFRHTGATQASALGIRDRILADVLGHVETSTTARYQHLSTNHLRAAMRKLWRRKRRRS